MSAEPIDLDAIRERDEARRVAIANGAHAKQLADHAERLAGNLAAAELERDRFREHSVTLNRVGFAMAKALGRVAEGTTSTEADVDELLAALVRDRDAWRDAASGWEDGAATAERDRDTLRKTLKGVTQHLGVVGYERHQLRATVERVHALCVTVEPSDAYVRGTIGFARLILDALSAADAPPVDASTSEAGTAGSDSAGLVETVAQAMRDANAPEAWTLGPQTVPFHHFAQVAINAIVRANLHRLDGSEASAVSLLSGVAAERLGEYGGMPGDATGEAPDGD
jgi:hypothetical protein